MRRATLNVMFLFFVALCAAVFVLEARASDLPKYHQCVEDTECAVTDDSITVWIPSYWTGLKVRDRVADQILTYCEDEHGGSTFRVFLGEDRVVAEGTCE